MRRRPRPRNRQTRKSLCQPRIEEGVLDFRAIGFRRNDNEVAMSPAVPAQPPHAASLGQAHRNSVTPRKRAICAPGCDLHPHRQRYADNWADGTVNSGDQIWLGLLWRNRRQGDHGMSGNQAASCAIRFGSEARMSRFRSALALPHSAISASDRPQPVQWPARALSAQMSMHGDFGVLTFSTDFQYRFISLASNVRPPPGILRYPAAAARGWLAFARNLRDFVRPSGCRRGVDPRLPKA